MRPTSAPWDIAADMTDKAQVGRAVSAAAFGPLHVAVNAAGTGTFGPVVDLSLPEERRVLAVNLTDVFLSIKYGRLTWPAAARS